ncbi:ATP-binding protein, partial [Mesorhizobium sp. M0500]
MLPERLNEFAIASGAGAVGHVEPLVNRIEVMLADARMKSLVSPSETLNLVDWLNGFIGENHASNGQVTIIDLSLVPSDVVHVAVSVIARLTFEALQRYRKRNGAPLPTIVVLEEAHTFVRKRCCGTTFREWSRSVRLPILYWDRRSA